jgi:hypothetical protein
MELRTSTAYVCIGMTQSKRNPLLVDVLAALGDVSISQRYLIDPAHKRSYFMHGQQDGKDITINEAPNIVSTLIHELVHYVRPTWSERTVRRFTTILIRQLTHKEIQAIYDQYRERRT